MKEPWNAETDPDHARTPQPVKTDKELLGYEPVNRSDRRKLAKLRKQEKN